MQALTPKEVFERFGEAAYQWNLRAIQMKAENAPYNIRAEKAKFELNEIFEQYVTQRKRAYVRGANFGTPPEYNAATNKMLSVTVEDKKAFIEVQETVGFKRKLRYVLHKKKDGWRVDKREPYSKSEDKWDAIPL
jgi:hypothetical protein